ncbi:hypothetical protein F4780DRAFT_786518 [Xylariomycetidae sp. FL0641]|nr:hypothetical protein F4780DRAFT_786518 [Xylariomycetidae sp. FL0641]
MGRSQLRKSSPVYLSSPPTEPSPSASVIDDWDTETAMGTSRPASLALPRSNSPFINPPSLAEILSDTAREPWTLSAFMAFLSQNHCLETLEFILDAQRYKAAHIQRSQGQHTFVPYNELYALWQKIMEAYIIPCAPREVNLPAPVRDRLLSLAYSTSEPADPSELDEAVKIVRELMNDSVLVPFLESAVPTTVEARAEEGVTETHHLRARHRKSREVVATDDHSTSPRTSLLPLFGKGHRAGIASANRSHSSSIESGEIDLTDDSHSPASTPGAEPMTPPTSPPTNEFTFGGSPNKTLQRTIAGHGWKKMGEKLGLSRKSKSIRRSNQQQHPPTSSHPALPSASAAIRTSKSATFPDSVNVLKNAWEDPHPGSKLVIPRRASNSEKDLHLHTTSGNAVDGVAAKARCATNTKRDGRLRARTISSKNLKIPVQVPEEPMPKGVSLKASQRSMPVMGSSPYLDTDVDTDVPGRMDSMKIDSTIVETTRHEHVHPNSPHQPCFTDFSNLLGLSRSDDDDDASVTIVDSDGPQRTPSMEDLYGWEAELDRKMQCGINASPVCDFNHCHFRQVTTKRSLLHRVLSASGRKS